MAPTEGVLFLQLLKNVLNILILPARSTWKDSVSSYSILILVLTDLSITVFIVGLWLSDCPLALGLDVVSVRFITFQNWTYNAVLVLLPGLILSDILCSDQDTHHPLLRPIFTLLCWMIGALYGFRYALWGEDNLDSENQTNHAFLPFSMPESTLLWVSLALTATYACSLMGPRTAMLHNLNPWEGGGILSATQEMFHAAIWLVVTGWLAWQSPFCGLNTVLILGLDTLGTAVRQMTQKLGLGFHILGRGVRNAPMVDGEHDIEGQRKSACA